MKKKRRTKVGDVGGLNTLWCPKEDSQTCGVNVEDLCCTSTHVTRCVGVISRFLK